MRPDRGAHSIHQLYAHLVFVTKYRRASIDGEVLQWLRAVFAEVCQSMNSELMSCHSDLNHVHVFVHYPPKVSIAELVNRLKGVSSYRLSENKVLPPWAKKHGYVAEQDGASAQREPKKRGSPFWSASYFVSSVGTHSITDVNDYFVKQEAKRRATKAAQSVMSGA